MRYLQNFEHFQKQMEAYWNVDYIDRCNLSIQIKDMNFEPVGNKYSLKEQFENPEVVDEMTRQLFDHTQFFAEGLPAKYVNFGTTGHAELLGAVPQYTKDTVWFDTTMPEPDSSGLQFNPDTNMAFKRQNDFLKKMVELANGDYLVSMPDNCGNLDTLAVLRGTEDLMIDMMEEEEYLPDAMKKIIDVWGISERSSYEILKQNNFGGSSHGWMQLWAPKMLTQLQCDASVMLSPSTFEQYALPELERCAKMVDYPIYHLDGIEELRHLDMILSVKEIRSIQWTPVAGQPKTSASIEALQKIQKAGKGLVVAPRLDELEFMLKNLSHKGLHMNVHNVKDAQMAQDIISLAEKCAGEMKY